jgi:hypothetical protein
MKSAKSGSYGFWAVCLVAFLSACSNPNAQPSKSTNQGEDQKSSEAYDAQLIKSALEKVEAAENSLKSEPEVPDASSADLEIYLVGESEGTADLKVSQGVAPQVKSESDLEAGADGKSDKPGEIAPKDRGMLRPCGSPSDASAKPPATGPCSPLMMDVRAALHEARKFHHQLVGYGKGPRFEEIKEKIKAIAKSAKGEDLKKKIEEIVKAMHESLEKEKAEIKSGRSENKELLRKLHDLKFGVLKSCLPAHGFLGNKIEFVDRLCKALPKLNLCEKVEELKAAVDSTAVCTKSVKDLRDFIKVSQEKLKLGVPAPAEVPAKP